MPYLTPPSSGKKNSFFGKASTGSVYYEDVYGRYNSDENLEDKPEHCETDSDSDEDRGPGSRKVNEKLELVSDPSSSSDREVGGEEDGEDEGNEQVLKYKIAPNVNSRHSVSKRRTPIRYAMFGRGAHINRGQVVSKGSRPIALRDTSSRDTGATDGESESDNFVHRRRNGRFSKHADSRLRVKQQPEKRNNDRRATRSLTRLAKEEQKVRRSMRIKSAVHQKGEATSKSSRSGGVSDADPQLFKAGKVFPNDSAIVVVDNNNIARSDYIYISD